MIGIIYLLWTSYDVGTSIVHELSWPKFKLELNQPSRFNSHSTQHSTTAVAAIAAAVVVGSFIRSFHFISVRFVVRCYCCFCFCSQYQNIYMQVNGWCMAQYTYSTLLYSTTERASEQTNIFNNNSNSSNSLVVCIGVCVLYSVHSLTVSPIAVHACVCVYVVYSIRYVRWTSFYEH